MRLLAIRVGLIDPHQTIELQAAADDSPSVGRWFSANLNLSTALALATTGVTLVGGWYSLQSSQARHEAQIAANAAAIRALSDKFDAQVVRRDEYQNHKRDEAADVAAVRDQVQQLYSVTLTSALLAQRSAKP